MARSAGHIFLPPASRATIREAIVEKGLKQGLDPKEHGVVDSGDTRKCIRALPLKYPSNRSTARTVLLHEVAMSGGCIDPGEPCSGGHYTPGSWGPKGSFDLIELDGRRWMHSKDEAEPIVACSL